MKTQDVAIAGKKGVGIVVDLPKVPLVLVTGAHGFVMCGYLNVEVAEKMGEAAAVVRGVKTVEDLLEAKITAVTSAAAARGVEVGRSGRDALACLL